MTALEVWKSLNPRQREAIHRDLHRLMREFPGLGFADAVRVFAASAGFRGLHE